MAEVVGSGNGPMNEQEKSKRYSRGEPAGDPSRTDAEAACALKTALLNHPLYQEINSLPALHLFMEHHVFAVWDFMSLLKALQQRFCCTEVPWLPSTDLLASRFINEIVLAEESDEDGAGGFVSHFGLYRRAMIRCAANTSTIDRFLMELHQGRTVPFALQLVGVPENVQRFVSRTFAFIEEGNLCASRPPSHLGGRTCYLECSSELSTN